MELNPIISSPEEIVNQRLDKISFNLQAVKTAIADKEKFIEQVNAEGQTVNPLTVSDLANLKEDLVRLTEQKLDATQQLNQIKESKNAAIEKVNTAEVVKNPIDPDKIIENNPPRPVVDVLKSFTTMPSISQGIVNGTIISKTNKSLSHVCDFANELKKNTALKEFILAGYSTIQKAIRAVLKELGSLDPSGSLSGLATWLKGLAEEIRSFNVEYLIPIKEFSQKVLGYVTWAKAVIAWIQSLPARLAAVLAGCLLKLLNSIKNVLLDAFQQIPNPFTDVIAATKDVLKEVNSATQTVFATVAYTQASAAGINSTLNKGSKSNSTGVSSAIQAISEPITQNNLSKVTGSIATITKSIPSANTVAAQNSQSNESKKTSP